MSEHHIIMDLMGIATTLRVVYHFETEKEMFAFKERIDFMYQYFNLKDEERACWYCGCELQIEDPQVMIDKKLMCTTCAQAYQDGASSTLEVQS